MLPRMSAGLNSILFAIIIDNESLNSFKNGVLLDRDAEILAAKVVSKPASKASTTESLSKKPFKKGHKKSSSQVISFNDDDNEIKTHIAKTSVIARNSNTDNDHDQIDK